VSESRVADLLDFCGFSTGFITRFVLAFATAANDANLRGAIK
jgi:hypothetical protein